MKEQEYIDACQRTEHKDMPARLRNLKTGEIGSVIQCLLGETPKAFLVQVGEDVTTWWPEDVEEVLTKH